MKIILAADHRGLVLKDAIKSYLTSSGFDIEDVGAHTLDKDDDYPDYAYPAAQIVATTAGAKGILFCGSGMGMDIVANKVKGVRAAIAYSKDAAVHGASLDGVNMITLAADVLDEETARAIVEAFLSTPLVQEERYARRLEKITAIEDENFR
ncbi:MAG: RpiB/LacA/LacB family sugar-phosphate isomerase [Minisyncoccia bacterium]